MQTILAPTDFSKNALNAVKYAVEFAIKTGSNICLYHSFTSPIGELSIPLMNKHFNKASAKENAELKMKKLIAKLTKKFPDINLTHFTEAGLATDNIIRHIKKHKIELVILGTTGEGTISRTLFGSTTSAIINDATCAVMAIPAKAKFKNIDKVTVATDLEKHSFNAFYKSALFAKELNAEIAFIYIEDESVFDVTSTLQNLVDEIKRKLDYDKISFHIGISSNIIDGLETFVKKEKPDLLAMITHSRKFPETIWKRSLTTIMSNNTTIPLVIFHSK